MTRSVGESVRDSIYWFSCSLSVQALQKKTSVYLVELHVRKKTRTHGAILLFLHTYIQEGFL